MAFTLSLISLASILDCRMSSRGLISQTSWLVLRVTWILISGGSFAMTMGMRRLPYSVYLTPRASKPLTLMLILSYKYQSWEGFSHKHTEISKSSSIWEAITCCFRIVWLIGPQPPCLRLLVTLQWLVMLLLRVEPQNNWTSRFLLKSGSNEQRFRRYPRTIWTGLIHL